MSKDCARFKEVKWTRRKWWKDLKVFLFPSRPARTCFTFQSKAVFVFPPVVTARLINIHKQREMCSLMSKSFCKKGSVLGKLAMSANTVSSPDSCISRITTSLFSTGLFASLIALLSLFFVFLDYLPHQKSCFCQSTLRCPHPEITTKRLM